MAPIFEAIKGARAGSRCGGTARLQQSRGLKSPRFQSRTDARLVHACIPAFENPWHGCMKVTQFSRVDSSGEISLKIHDPGTKSAA
jgi:hypothetical protein